MKYKWWVYRIFSIVLALCALVGGLLLAALFETPNSGLVTIGGMTAIFSLALWGAVINHGKAVQGKKESDQENNTIFL